MSTEELVKVAQAFALTAAYYRVKIEDQVLKMYAEDVSDLDFNEVIVALGSYRRDPKNRQMPLPAQIRDIVEPEPTPESGGRDVASSIQCAIVKYGYSNEGLARQFIGPQGWDVVQRWGGWSHLCTNMGVSIDPGQFYAQVRDFAIDAARFPSLRREFPTALPEPVQRMELLSGETMPDGQPVAEFEINRRERLQQLMDDMDRRQKEFRK